MTYGQILEQVKQNAQIQSKELLNVKSISEINKSPKAEIEGVGTVAQYDIIHKLYMLNVVDWKQVQQSKKVAFTSEYLTKMVHQYNLFQREF
jgi:hypothetical protein